MKIVIALLILLPLAGTAQHTKEETKPKDSLRLYRRQLYDLQKRAYDSLKASEAYQELQQKINDRLERSDAYTSFNIFLSLAGADYDVLNASIAAEGFPAFGNVVGQYGFGFTIKKQRFVWDITYAGLGIKRTSRHDDEKIKASYNSVVLVDVGYDFVKSPAVNIYPYAGLGMRIAQLSYSSPVIVNNTPGSIADIVQNNQSVSGDQYRLSYQAGIGFDFVIDRNKEHTSGTMVYLKAGTSGIVGNKEYDMEGVKYNPRIKYGEWIVTAGFRFFGRR
ncbi:MAG: hypothetical protein QM731_12220 [Chitinophagaceae bacterium]